jgi:hypothetical protein
MINPDAVNVVPTPKQGICMLMSLTQTISHLKKRGSQTLNNYNLLQRIGELQ